MKHEDQGVGHIGSRSQRVGQPWERSRPPLQLPQQDVVLDCGWGKLIFAHTFPDNERLARTIADEAPGTRNIAFYVKEPHVLLSKAPAELFLDPSHTFRLWFSNYQPARPRRREYIVRQVRKETDAAAINRIYNLRHMVPVNPEFVWAHRTDPRLVYLVAEDTRTGEIIGTTTGVNHAATFEDPEKGSSLWCLAISAATPYSGVGQALVRHLAEHFQTQGCSFMDLSVLHDNAGAIGLYEKLGFERVPLFCVKRKNPINQPLFVTHEEVKELNPYAAIIVKEAQRRGINVQVIDAEEGYFALELAGRKVICRESLSELTSAVAMSRCQNKRVTLRVLREAGLAVPAQTLAGKREDNERFLEEYAPLVVKPLNGEQGAGISTDINTYEELAAAVRHARKLGERVLMEEQVEGDDLRVIVIKYEVVAAAVRQPPTVTGTGQETVSQLIRKQSRRRQAATEGESRIPLDEETRRCVRQAGYEMDEVLPAGESIRVRRTANLHTGGVLRDVTDELHPALREAAVKAARALAIPVVGLDFLVPDVAGPDHVIIEANERPGLANHEPQPTAQKFIDLLFPQTGYRAHDTYIGSPGSR